MNLLRDAPAWAQLLLLLLLVAAAAQDIVKRRISNLICLGVIVAAVAAALATGPTPALWQNGALFVLLILLSLPAFAAGWVGGGDVKLLAAVGLWVDFKGALGLLSCIFIAGGVIAAAALLLRRRRLSKTSKGVPYGVAIAVGGAIMLAYPALLQPRPEPANPLDLHAARAAARP
jgi:prepilin peptidase CpaA